MKKGTIWGIVIFFLLIMVLAFFLLRRKKKGFNAQTSQSSNTGSDDAKNIPIIVNFPFQSETESGEIIDEVLSFDTNPQNFNVGEQLVSLRDGVSLVNTNPSLSTNAETFDIIGTFEGYNEENIFIKLNNDTYYIIRSIDGGTIGKPVNS